MRDWVLTAEVNTLRLGVQDLNKNSGFRNVIEGCRLQGRRLTIEKVGG